MLNHLKETSDIPVATIAANTDVQALNTSSADHKIQLGKVSTRGLGAGMDPQKGRDAAIEAEEEIRDSIRGNDVVFVTAGMGGGTGTGAAPVVSKIAKDSGALTIAVVTTPFKFEGKKRTRLAKEGLREVQETADSTITISNEKLLEIAEANLGFKEAFAMVDMVLTKAVVGISSVIGDNANASINLDFADFKTIMTHKGDAMMSLGTGKGESASSDALDSALHSPLLDDTDITGAKGVLIHFEIHPDYPLAELSKSMEFIEEKVHEDADIIFGTTYDSSLDPDQVRVTVVISGIPNEEISVHPEQPRGIELLKERAETMGTPPVEPDNLDTPAFLRRQFSAV